MLLSESLNWRLATPFSNASAHTRNTGQLNTMRFLDVISPANLEGSKLRGLGMAR